ncbi:4,5-dioxygenase [Streptomyces cavourensis]|jgi:DOPA 4,5-dioxygenase|uniref:DOPA 4,5-dioxygenase family protein n=1 Tax=unclassified Achromobacter TaxID=2626865 RepID=UPI000E08AA0A|nr:4,5-dioxygenase [Streptomyces cavourensis]
MILNPELVDSWHAHVYFNADSRDAAWNLREQVIAHFGDTVDMGRFHERPVGPHPQWSYQIAFAPAALHQVMTWLTLNHGALDVFLHPNTGQSLRDHRDCAAWIGHSHVLNLAALGG